MTERKGKNWGQNGMGGMGREDRKDCSSFSLTDNRRRRRPLPSTSREESYAGWRWWMGPDQSHPILCFFKPKNRNCSLEQHFAKTFEFSSFCEFCWKGNLSYPSLPCLSLHIAQKSSIVIRMGKAGKGGKSVSIPPHFLAPEKLPFLKKRRPWRGGRIPE